MSDTETITITLKEYKELLIIKGKYEELKEQKQQITYIPWNTRITYNNTDDWLEKETKPYKITCN